MAIRSSAEIARAIARLTGGPRLPGRLQSTLGVDPAALRAVLTDLADTALVSGGGLSLLVADESVASTLVGAHAMGDTVLTVADASVFRRGRRVQVGGELHDAVAVDAGANTITIAAPGLTGVRPNAQDAGSTWAGAAVAQAPLLGTGDALALPAPAAGRYAELDVRLLYNLPQLNGNPAFYNGRSTGAYFSGGGRAGSWFETLANYSSWWANGQTDPDESGTWTVGLLHATANIAASVWSVELDPEAHALSIVAVAAQELYIPRVTNLIVAGR